MFKILLVLVFIAIVSGWNLKTSLENAQDVTDSTKAPRRLTRLCQCVCGIVRSLGRLAKRCFGKLRLTCCPESRETNSTENKNYHFRSNHSSALNISTGTKG